MEDVLASEIDSYLEKNWESIVADIERVVRMVTEGVVTAVDGTDVPLRADSICVHGDGEKALLFVRKIRAALEAKGVALRAL